MWLALESSGDLASVAIGGPGTLVAEAEISGARRHAGALLGLIDQVLSQAGATEAEIEGIVISDGPGGFTGLRIGATVAKAMIRTRRRPLWSAPALHALGTAHAGGEGSTVAVLGDALRGEVYATIVRTSRGGIEVLLAPSVWHPEQLAGQGPVPDQLVIRPEGPRLVPAAWGAVSTIVDSPRARYLLDLVGRPGGARLVQDPSAWEPDYGRPAEAQAKWEATHGRRLENPTGQYR